MCIQNANYRNRSVRQVSERNRIRGYRCVERKTFSDHVTAVYRDEYTFYRGKNTAGYHGSPIEKWRLRGNGDCGFHAFKSLARAKKFAKGNRRARVVRVELWGLTAIERDNKKVEIGYRSEFMRIVRFISPVKKATRKIYE